MGNDNVRYLLNEAPRLTALERKLLKLNSELHEMGLNHPEQNKADAEMRDAVDGVFDLVNVADNGESSPQNLTPTLILVQRDRQPMKPATQILTKNKAPQQESGILNSIGDSIQLLMEWSPRLLPSSPHSNSLLLINTLST